MTIFQSIKVSLLGVFLLTATSHSLAIAQVKLTPSIFILQQANNIPLKTFVYTWPSLGKCISFLDKVNSIDEACLDGLLKQNNKRQVGALNLKSQLLRNRGDNELAIELIKKAITIAPEQHLNYFQLAINHYQKLRKTPNGREKWMLSMATGKAYRKAYQLDPTQFHYRYYITYDYLQVPESMGGSKQKALDLANDAISQGYVAFHPVRADILYQMNNKESARSAYISALEAKQYKRSSFKKALQLVENDAQLTRRFKQFIHQAELIISNQS